MHTTNVTPDTAVAASGSFPTGFPVAMPTRFTGLGGKGYKEMGYADAKDNGFSLSGSYGKFSGGIKMADNATVCDSRGNCMVTDKLKTVGYG
jgi:hypothetical protein